MAFLRLIARLDVKGENIIKAVQLEGLRVVGNPQNFAVRYYREGIDEIIYMDTVASLYGRNNLFDILRHTADNVFIPITAGGGVRSEEDAYTLLRSGADKVAINTAAIKRPEIISELANKFGSQCIVLSIDAKKISEGKWQAYNDNGREKTGLDAVDWIKHGVELGAGEILLTSIDQEGTCEGFDIDLVQTASDSVTVPVIASGGMGTLQHLVDVAREGRADAIAFAHVLHYEEISISNIRNHAIQQGLNVRSV